MRWVRDAKHRVVLGVLAAGVAVAAGAGFAAAYWLGSDATGQSAGHSGQRPTIKVGLAYDLHGRGDRSFNDAAADGLDRITRELKIEKKELEAVPGETEDDKYARLKLLCQGGFDPVIAVGFGYAGVDPGAGPLARAASECRNTRFAIVDDGSVVAGNVANLLFAEEQGSFLVGVAAALKTQTGTIGFLGGCDVGVIRKFRAGYEAGARAVDPQVKIVSRYLSAPADGCAGFNDASAGEVASGTIYDAGADVVYHAAGGSGMGVFRAAKARGKRAIGADTDQYVTVDSDLRDVILTSMFKRVDLAIYTFVESAVKGDFRAGPHVFDLKSGGVGYATSGGRVDDLKLRLDGYKRQIIGGTITVPTELQG